MILKITDKESIFGLGVIHMSLSDFADKRHYPFIATNEWERVEIDLCDETPVGLLSQMGDLQCKIIPVFDREAITARVLVLLCELYPDDRPMLRSLYKSDKEAFRRYVESMAEKRMWDELTTKGGMAVC